MRRAVTRLAVPAFGLLVYAAVLAALAPATLLDARLQSASDGRLRNYIVTATN